VAALPIFRIPLLFLPVVGDTVIQGGLGYVFLPEIRTWQEERVYIMREEDDKAERRSQCLLPCLY